MTNYFSIANISNWLADTPTRWTGCNVNNNL